MVQYIDPRSQKSLDRRVCLEREHIRCVNPKSGKAEFKQLYSTITNVVQENSGNIFIIGGYWLTRGA